MTPLDDHPQQRRPLFFPVVIATALLTIIGMVGGYLLAQHRSGEQPDPAPTPTLGLVNGPLCPKQTQRMGAEHGASGELREVLEVRTVRKTVVWICQDRAGQLFYHANKGGTDAKWEEGKTALFLSNAWPEGDEGYAVEAWDGNVFSVNHERLLITYSDGTQEEQKVAGE
ncbi:hypothetical protein [Actinoplanes sp. GCM10030250]|uniref:hypothetical protein n=1 Tax=Actinoplanes sp. GCM10030250 TaxID=3273376 RepID=UPI00360C7A42